jgi:hypothetical protein
MTLLLNLVGPHGIHQSSDFRLTDVTTRRPIEDELGSKQLHHMTSKWIALISFTGFARIGNRKTREWILDSLKASTGSVDEAMAAIASRAAVELRHIPQQNWFLTIVATVIEGGRASRLFVISCVDRPVQPPLSSPLDHFEVYELSTTNSWVLVFGCVPSVTKADRKFLENLNRGRMDPAEIRHCLARVNARSSKKSAGAVSQGCFVSSTTLDGMIVYENFGGTPGITADMADSAQMVEVITKAQGGKPMLRQGRAGATVGSKELTSGPMIVSEGSSLIAKYVSDSPALFVIDSSGNTFKEGAKHPRTNTIDEAADWAKLEEGLLAGTTLHIPFSLTSHSVTINGPDGSKYAFMEIVGMSGDAVLTKNRVTKITLGTAAIHITPGFTHQAKAINTRCDVHSPLTINGVHPHNWGYIVDVVFDASGGTISIQRSAVALRSTNSPLLQPCVTETEELVVVSSANPGEMKISKDQPSASASIEARLFLRDISRTTDSRP